MIYDSHGNVGNGVPSNASNSSNRESFASEGRVAVWTTTYPSSITGSDPFPIGLDAGEPVDLDLSASPIAPKLDEFLNRENAGQILH